jgi:hypothetical protein
MVLLFQTEWRSWRSQPQRGSRTQTVPRPSRPARLDRCTTASASWSGIIAAPAVSIMPAAPGETTRPTIDRYGCKRAAETRARATRLPSGIAPRVADYEDASALKRALAGIDDMVLISSDGDASAVMRHHADAIEAATATNIRHITFTSIVDTDEFVAILLLACLPRRRVPTSGLQCAFDHPQCGSGSPCRAAVLAGVMPR